MDFPRRPVSSYLRGTRRSKVAGLEALRDLGVKATDVFAAAISFLLARYADREQFPLGVIADGLREVRLLHADLKNNPSFSETLNRQRFETLSEIPQRGACFDARSDFQVLLLHHDAVQSIREELPPENRRWMVNFDLVFTVAGTECEWQLDCEYDEDLFAPQTIEALLRHLGTILKTCTNSPETQLWDMMLLDALEEDQLLVKWNKTSCNYPAGETIQNLFEQQAQKSCEKLAILFNGEALTFKELDNRTATLANYLQNTGTSPGAVVGVLMDRTADAIVAILGILRAGGIYLPLDSAYPVDRLRLMLNDSGAQRLLTNTNGVRLAKQLAVDVPALDIESSWPNIEKYTPSAPHLDVALTETFCIIYTSGSTGTPKAVPCEQRPSLNCFYWMWNEFPFADDEVCCLTTSLSFGDSIQELFGPLLQGLPVVVVSRDEVKDLVRLVERLRTHRVTRIVLVPSLLRVLVERFSNLGADLPDLKLWISSGEALPRHVAKQFFETVPEARLVNMYGTSELSNDVTAQVLTQNDLKGRAVPIGRPISNTTAFVLDKHMNPVPRGAVGELYVGGAGLVSGYLNDQHLTEQRFTRASVIRTRLSFSENERLYRTGDLVRLDSVRDSLEYIGRADSQVNVRGFRVELGEIEAALEHHESVRQACVVQRQHPSGEERLIAYVVLHEGRQFDSDGVLQEARMRLPSYMLPFHVVQIEEAPLTPSGKICRRNLPNPSDVIERRLSSKSPGPRDEIERQLVQIWRDTLWLSTVGVHDDFFLIGGHSLAAMDVALRIENSLGVQLDAGEVYRNPTIESLAIVVRRGLPAEQTKT
jgi:amino acid adenylation domain-containing protein